MTNNMGTFDRFTRAVLGPIFVALGVFWVSGILQILLVLLGAIISLTAMLGFCPLYLPFKFSTNRSDAKLGGIAAISLPLTIIVALVIASYASVYVTKKQFFENYNAMNGNYKQALFQTGQQNRDEAIKYYSQLKTTYADFYGKYQTYRPYVLWNDSQFNADLGKINGIITDTELLVQSGDLTEAHVSLEQVRPIFQEMFKRNNFSLLAMNLVDFHDVMETLIADSANKDAAALIQHYQEADRLLTGVEADLNDSDVQAVRANLNALLKLAQDGKVDDLAAQADALKKSFIKVYLLRG
jgi:hypothetical protein